VASNSVYACTGAESRPLLIVTALDAERAPIEGLATGLTRRVLRAGGDEDLLIGAINGIAVALLRCGVGKLSAALATTSAMELSPRGVISVGSAASLHPGFAIGDVVISNEVLQHDFGAARSGGFDLFGYGAPLPSAGDPRIRAAERLGAGALAAASSVAEQLIDPAGTGKAMRLSRGVIATGDAFINDHATRDAIQARTGADVVEMEGAAVAYVATRHGTPWLVVRSVSDAGDGGADVSFDRYLPIAAQNAATVVAAILPAFSA
jgi:adenosylhomocysteine nucleosidase